MRRRRIERRLGLRVDDPILSANLVRILRLASESRTRRLSPRQKKALQPHGAGLKIKSTDRPADLAEFGADPQNPFPNGRRATPQASRREAQATREAYRESARPFAPRSLANPPRRDRELRFPQFEACAKAALAKFLSFHWHGARPDARARRRESLPARTREQNNSHSPSRRAKFNCHIRALP